MRFKAQSGSDADGAADIERAQLQRLLIISTHSAVDSAVW